MANFIRRLSTHFRTDRKKEDDARANGISPGYSTHGKPTVNGKRRSSYGTRKLSVQKEHPDHSGEREGISNTFESFANLIHASNRPLPTQTGNGTYVEDKDAHTGLWEDLKTIGLRDVKTLTETMKSKANGGLVDDKTMLMERVIQVKSAGNKLPR